MFQNPAYSLTLFFLLKWRHGPHRHISGEGQGGGNPGEYERGGDTENGTGEGGRRREVSDTRKMQ